jgi:hypothetical protein
MFTDYPRDITLYTHPPVLVYDIKQLLAVGFICPNYFCSYNMTLPVVPYLFVYKFPRGAVSITEQY